MWTFWDFFNFGNYLRNEICNVSILFKYIWSHELKSLSVTGISSLISEIIHQENNCKYNSFPWKVENIKKMLIVTLVTFEKKLMISSFVGRNYWSSCRVCLGHWMYSSVVETITLHLKLHSCIRNRGVVDNIIVTKTVILPKNGKKCRHRQFLACFLPFLGPLQTIKHHQTLFFL